MSTITKYIRVSLGILCMAMLVYCLILRNERDGALYKIDTLYTQLDVTIKSAESLKGYISILEEQAEQNDRYIIDLEALRAETEQKSTKQAEQFKHAKHNNQNITKWADVELPARLY